MIKTIHEPARDINVRAEVDILVVGGGPAGIMAAEAAAQDKNLKVMLLEQRGFLGGNLVLGLPILSFLDADGNQVIKGATQRFVDRLAARGMATGHKRCKLHMSLTMVDPEEVKTEAWKIMEESGVDVLMYVFVSDAIVEDGKVKGVIIESKAGREAILAKTVIDCSGDADVAYRAGVECTKGDEKGLMQPPTLMFLMRGVNLPQVRDNVVNHSDEYAMDIMPPEQFAQGNFTMVGYRKQLAKAIAEDNLNITVARTIFMTGIKDDEVWVNMTRVSGVDGTDPVSYTYAERECRKQMYDVAKYLIKYIPGFENAYIAIVPPFTGIRETRVIVGKYVMTAEDLLGAYRCDDAIAVASYPIDLHHEVGGDCTLIYGEGPYDIAYRTLVPEKIKGLLVAGRCSSMNHGAMAATRVMSTVMAMGEAAGHAAAVAVADGVDVSEVDVKKVQQRILDNGGYLR